MQVTPDFKKFINNLTEGIAVVSEDGALLHTNEAWQNLPTNIQAFIVSKVPEHENGKFHCVETSICIEVAKFEDYRIATVFREKERLVVKDNILRAMLFEVDHRKTVFENAAISLTKNLSWRWAVITRLSDSENVESLAFCDNSKLLDNISYALYGTPCEATIKDKGFIHFDDIPLQYPEDKGLIDLGVKSYAGLVYKDSNSIPLGHVFLMHDHKHVDWQLAEETLQMVTTIVGAQLSLEASEKEVKKHKNLAATDELTGLCNRLGFNKSMGFEIDKLKTDDKYEFLLSIIDLDGMKQINDTLGHNEGDRLLKTFSQSLKNMGRNSDHFFRLGGDEFACIFRSTSMSQEHLIRQRLENAVKQTREANFPSVGASIGFVSSEEYDGNLEHILELADQRMYQEKNSKK